jgi:hypothetical protein
MDLEDIFQEIWDLETDFFNNEKEDNHYYIGMNNVAQSELLIASSLSVDTFFKYNIDSILYYLYYSSIFGTLRYDVDIMKLYINSNGCYTVSVKTYWLRLVQRHIKKFYINKIGILIKRVLTNNYFQTTRDYPINLRVPTLYGILSCYNNKK